MSKGAYYYLYRIKMVKAGLLKSVAITYKTGRANPKIRVISEMVYNNKKTNFKRVEL